MAADLLDKSDWVCRATAPGEFDERSIVGAGDWIGATVPGTAAAALLADGHSAEQVADRSYDEEDWWFRTTFPGGDLGPIVLHCAGLATLADVWLNGVRVLRSDNMFVASETVIPSLESSNDLILHFSALGPLVRRRHRRPRWRTPRLPSQHLRWYRTTLFGRIVDAVPVPTPVGPWRSVSVFPLRDAPPADLSVHAFCDPAGTGGSVEVRVRLHGIWTEVATLEVAGTRVALAPQTPPLDSSQVQTTYSGSVTLAEIRRWWPHTHGEPNLYLAQLTLGDRCLSLGHIGFRSVAVDRDDGGFTVSVNGVPIFARGACWTPLDPVGLSADGAELRLVLEQFRRANLNMVRVPGETLYEDSVFFDLCDELGILVWQDCMFSTVDIPDDETFLASVRTELSQLFCRLGARPSISVVSGGSELEQSAAMAGVPRSQLTTPPVQAVFTDLAAEQLPGIPFVTSSPSGGVLPIQTDVGIAHYYGVGAYLRPLEDARRADVRFAAECLAFAVPPEPHTVDTHCGGAARAGHHPSWKRAVNRDAGASWDFEDVVDHYVAALFGVERAQVRYADPERALDLCRVSVASLVEATMSEWRRTTSRCAGAILLQYRDVLPGAGWGLVDSLGDQKAPWYALRRAMAPVAVLLTDEGLNGIRAHLVNDGVRPWTGTLRTELFARGVVCLETATANVQIPARGGTSIDLAGSFDGFRDMNHAYRFGPPAFDVVAVTLIAEDGVEAAQAVHLPLGHNRPLEDELNITAVATVEPDGSWVVELMANRFAHWVRFELEAGESDDSYFHLLPGRSRRVSLRTSVPPKGVVGCLNTRSRFRITMA